MLENNPESILTGCLKYDMIEIGGVIMADSLMVFQNVENYKTINVEDLDTELQTHSENFGTLARLHANVLVLLEQQKIQVDEMEGKVLLAAKMEDPKRTEKVLTALVDTSLEVLQLKSNQAELHGRKIYLDNMIKVMETKTTMLVNLAKRQLLAEGEGMRV